MAAVVIDLNVRTNGDLTYSLLDDVQGTVAPGAVVRVVEPESDIVGTATVARIDHRKGLIYLAVDWSSLHTSTPEDQEVPASDSLLLRTGGSFPLRLDDAGFGQSVHLDGGSYFQPVSVFQGVEPLTSTGARSRGLVNA